MDVDLTYEDHSTNIDVIKGDTSPFGITDHTLLSSIGSNSHAEIDAHIATPHVTAHSDLTGLDTVASHNATAIYNSPRTEGPTSNNVQDALYEIQDEVSSLVGGLIGPEGPEGPEGPQGIQGVQGIQGLTGDAGIQGLQGVQGDQGIQGIQGPIGLTGLTGDQGIQGEQGSGVTIQGTDTIANILLKTNTEGHMWVSTDSGLDDLGNTVTAGDGIVSAGTDWYTVGPVRGPTGPQGIQGIQGIQGVQGIQGDIGLTGDAGADGIDGTNGVDGVDGSDATVTYGSDAEVEAGILDDVSISPKTLHQSAITFNNAAMALGNVSNTLVEIPLRNSLAMKGGVGSVTLERASVATYKDIYGVLQTAGADEPRFERDGFLHEDGGTNLSLYSEDSSEWSSNISITLSSQAELGPDNLSLASKFVWDNGYKGSQLAHGTRCAYVNGDERTDSIYIKDEGFPWVRLQSTTGTTPVYAFFDLVNGVVGTELDCTGYIEECVNGYYRCSITRTQDADGSSYMSVYNASSDADFTSTGDGVNGYSICYPQVEKFHYATSYIPSTDVVGSRVSDKLYIDKYNNFPNWNRTKTIAIDFDVPSVLSPSNRFLLHDGLTANGYFNISTLGNLTSNNGGGLLSDGSIDAATSYRFIMANDDTDTFTYLNGEISSTDTNIGTSNVDQDKLYIGSRVGNDSFYGHISNVRIWLEKLTDTEARLA